jgi:U3 small nucleolar RNA-associated protein 21
VRALPLLCTSNAHENLPDETLFSYAKTLSPAALDLELRSLVTLDQLRTFLDALIGRLRSRRDFEAVQTLQNVFLRMHGETIIANEELRSSLELLGQIQRSESDKVLELLSASLGTLGFVRDVV